MENEIIQFSRLCLLDDLPHFLEALQGEQAVAEVLIWADIIRGEAQAFAMRLRGLLILPQRGVHVAQIGMCARGLAGSSRSPPDTFVPLSPVPRLHSDSSQR